MRRKQWSVAISVLAVLALGSGLWFAFSFGGEDDCPMAAAEDGPLALIVISNGASDALTLEWTGGPADVTRWEFRLRKWERSTAQAWGSWQSIPDSGPLTRTYRLKGLHTDAAYDAQVRAVVGTTAGNASNTGEGLTYPEHARAVGIFPGQIVEGDGKTLWLSHGSGRPFTIPDGMRLVGGYAWVDGPDGVGGVSLFDLESGSSIAFGSYGQELGRTIRCKGDRDVGALFDQMFGPEPEPFPTVPPP